MPQRPPEQPSSGSLAPPMSTTSLPVDARQNSSPAMRVRPPVLASDILREEVAPIAPARRLIRVWLGSFAAVFALAAVASRLGMTSAAPGIFEGSVATAILAAIAALVPAPYAARAVIAAIAGLAPLLLGAAGLGPLAAVGHEGGLRAGVGLVLVTALPGALLFRGRYRAFRAARIILAAVLVACIPTLGFLLSGALDSGAVPASRLVDAALVVATLTALFGFMGEETTGGCSGWAGLVLAVHAARLASLGWIPGHATASSTHTPWGFLVGASGELAAGGLIAFALYQLLAVAFAARAREVDVHRVAGADRQDDPFAEADETTGDDDAE